MLSEALKDRAQATDAVDRMAKRYLSIVGYLGHVQDLNVTLERTGAGEPDYIQFDFWHKPPNKNHHERFRVPVLAVERALAAN